jgi:hypothetical protein
VDIFLELSIYASIWDILHSFIGTLFPCISFHFLEYIILCVCVCVCVCAHARVRERESVGRITISVCVSSQVKIYMKPQSSCWTAARVITRSFSLVHTVLLFHTSHILQVVLPLTGHQIVH